MYCNPTLKWPASDSMGHYYTVSNTTPGTGIAGHAAPTTADATKPLLWVINNALALSPPSSNGVNIYLDYINVRVTAVGAGATTTDFSLFVDPGAAKASGGTVVTPKNTYSGTTFAAPPPASNATAQIGATLLTNAAAVHLFHRRVRSVVPVVEDLYHFSFGSPDSALPAAQATSGTNIVSAYVHCPPVVVGPGASLIFVEWGLSQTGAHSFDIECGYWEI